MGFVPDRVDLQILARHYLKEHINWERYSFLTGNQSSSDAAYSHHCYERFKEITGFLGEAAPRKIIDQIDDDMLSEHGDVWHAFKAGCKPGFFSTPHDPLALVRLAKEIPEGKWDEASNHYGVECLQMLRDALESSEEVTQ